MIWDKTDIDPTMVRSLINRFGIDPLVASILVRRGVTEPEDIKYFLESDLRYLYNPFLFNEMEDVIDRIQMSREEGEKVLVFGDKDVDGVTSSVILYETLKEYNIDVSWTVPTGNDSYGLSEKIVEDAYNGDISLIITVDCGISAFEAIKKAKNYGIDVIILDHHNPRDGKLPDTDLIINPKIENCGYPNINLAACGVVSKVIWALSLSKIDSLYKSTLCFLHVEDTGKGLIIEAVKLYNLVQVSQMRIDTSDTNNQSLSNLVDFLKGQTILIFNEKEQKKLLKSVFGHSVDVNAFDIKPEIERVLSGIKGADLSSLNNQSKMRLYSNRQYTQLDLIVNLFITYVERRYSDYFQPFTNALDLVALGTVADLMELKGENRILVKKGLEILCRTEREGLQALLLKLNLLGKNITSKEISWVLAPVINSAGRMKKADLAAKVLLCEERDLKNKLALEIVALNKERKSISENIWTDIYEDLHQSYEEFNKKLIVIFHRNMLKGVTGIIASRAQAIFSVPVIIIAKENDELTGSIRSAGNLNIQLLFNKTEDLLQEWGGHNSAAGFKLKYSNLTKLINRFHSVLNIKDLFIKTDVDSSRLKVDAYIPKEYLNPDIIKVCDTFEPYGEGNDLLVFVTKEVKILDINFVGKGEKNHLKLLFEAGEYKWPGIFWNSANRVGIDFTKGDLVDIAYRVERNFYGGNETLQLNVLDILK